MPHNSKATIDHRREASDTMFRSGGPSDKRQARELVADFKRPAAERARDIRMWLTEALAPHIDGPYAPRSFFKSDAPGGWYEHLTLSTGSGIYRIAAERGGWVENCVDALRENAELEKLLSEGGDSDSIMRLSVRQGQFVERIFARAIFGPLVAIGRRLKVDVPQKMRDEKARIDERERIDKHERAVEAMENAMHKLPDASKLDLKRHAAMRLNISVSQLNRRLRYGA